MADGFEEIEALTAVDLLRRAGAEVTTVKVSKDDNSRDKNVMGSHKISVCADALLSEINFGIADCIVLPGGMPGSANLAASGGLDKIIRDFDAADKLICAICAAPAVVLGAKGILNGRTFTCYPGAEAQVICGGRAGEGCAQWSSSPVVKDGNLITSRAPGTAIKFSLKIIEALFDKDTSLKIQEQIVYN